VLAAIAAVAAAEQRAFAAGSFAAFNPLGALPLPHRAPPHSEAGEVAAAIAAVDAAERARSGHGGTSCGAPAASPSVHVARDSANSPGSAEFEFRYGSRHAHGSARQQPASSTEAEAAAAAIGAVAAAHAKELWAADAPPAREGAKKPAT
jgi:hypothetical protein